MFVMSRRGHGHDRLRQRLRRRHLGAPTSARQQVWNYIQMPGMAVGASVSSMAGAERRRRALGPGRRASPASASCCSVAVTGTCAIVIYLLGPLPLYIFLPLRLADHPDRPAHQPHGALGVRDLQRHLRADRHRALDRRGLAAADDPGLLDAGDPRPVRLTFMIPHFGPGGDLVELPARHPDLQRLTVLYYRFGGWRKVRMLHPEAGGEVPDAPVSHAADGLRTRTTRRRPRRRPSASRRRRRPERLELFENEGEESHAIRHLLRAPAAAAVDRGPASRSCSRTRWTRSSWPTGSASTTSGRSSTTSWRNTPTPPRRRSSSPPARSAPSTSASATASC